MNEHPFAQYVRILGRGKKGSRSLTQEESYAAMRMILNDEVDRVQLGAFLMLLRVKEESPDELAGFVAAARGLLTLPEENFDTLVDWPSYAGKRRQLPWYILAALLLAQNEIPVMMHGTRGTKDDRIYAVDAFKALDIPISHSLKQAAYNISAHNFAYAPLEDFCPKLKEILDLRQLFGLRSPINTLLRLLNPQHAPYMMQSTFHPGYRQVHQRAALMLGQPNMAVIKGEGGEAERDPNTDCQVFYVHEANKFNEEWPAIFAGKRHLKDKTMNVQRLKAMWSGEINDVYGLAAITGTVAIVLRMTDKAKNRSQAEKMAEEMWQNRPSSYYP